MGVCISVVGCSVRREFSGSRRELFPKSGARVESGPEGHSHRTTALCPCAALSNTFHNLDKYILHCEQIHFSTWTEGHSHLTLCRCAALSKLCTERQQTRRGCTWCAAHCVAREECSSHHGPYLPPQIPLKTHHFDAGQTHHSAHRAEAPQRKPGKGGGGLH